MSTQFHNYQLEDVYASIDESLVSDVAKFWINNGAIQNPDTCRQRARQLVVVARADDGEIAGVSTAFTQTVAHNDAESCLIYRTFIAPKHRIPGLYVAIFNASRDALRAHVKGPDAPKKLMFVLENKKFLSPASKRIFERNECSFVGYDQRGLEVWQTRLDQPAQP